MKSYTRAELQAALSVAFTAQLDALDVEQSPEILMAVFKAMMNIAFDCLETEAAPRELVAAKLTRIARNRLLRLKPVLPSWSMKQGVA